MMCSAPTWAESATACPTSKLHRWLHCSLSRYSRLSQVYREQLADANLVQEAISAGRSFSALCSSWFGSSLSSWVLLLPWCHFRAQMSFKLSATNQMKFQLICHGLKSKLTSLTIRSMATPAITCAQLSALASQKMLRIGSLWVRAGWTSFNEPWPREQSALMEMHWKMTKVGIVCSPLLTRHSPTTETLRIATTLYRPSTTLQLQAVALISHQVWTSKLDWKS